MSEELGDLVYKLGLDGQEEFEKGVKKSETSMKSLADSFSKVGKEMTMKVTLPILGLGTAALKLASDFEVSSKKFSTAFKGSEKAATSAVENLNQVYSVSNSQATQLLGNTGDLLKGLGYTSDQALATSLSVQQLAASLSAYNGVGIDVASGAITKGLLGQTEGFQQLGIKIDETMVAAELLARGQEDLTGTALAAAKAEVILAVAYKQSGDAVSSFSQNTDTAAFQTQALLGNLSDLGNEFGQMLLPLFKDLVAGLKEGVAWFRDLSQEQKQTILMMAGLAAAIGPVISIIGGVIGAVGSLQVALAFLAANPIVLVIAGLAAATAGVIAWSVAAEKSHTKELTEEFGALGEELGVAKEEMKDFVHYAEAVDDSITGMDGQSFEDMSYQVEQLADNLGLTKSTVLAIALENEDLSATYREQLQTLKNQIDAETNLLFAQAQKNIVASGLLERENFINDLKQKQLDKEVKITKEKSNQNELQKKATDSYISAADFIAQTIGNQGKSAEELAIQEKIKKVTEDANGQKLQWGANSQLEIDRLKALAIFNQELADLKKANADAELQSIDELNKSYIDKTNELLGIKTDNLEAERQAAIDEAKKLGADVALVEEYYAKLKEDKEKEARDKKLAEEKKYWDTVGQYTIQGVGQIASIVDGLYTIQLNNIEATAQATIESLDQQALADKAYAAELEKIKAGTSEYTLENIDREAIAKQALADETNRIEKEAALASWKIQKEQFFAKQIADSVKITMDTATAVLKGYADLGPIGGSIAAAILIGLGAVQAGMIWSQPPPKRPALAEGGVISSTPGGVPVTVSEAGYDEAVIPLNDDFYNKLASAARGQSEGTYSQGSDSGKIILQNILDGKIISEAVVSNINNKQYLIKAGSII